MNRFGVLLLLLIILFSSNLVKSVIETQSNLERLNKLRQEAAFLKEGVEALKKEVDYKNTNEYLEREARDRLGLIRSGERLIILPEDSNILSSQATPIKKDQTPNWIKWKRFLFE